MKTLRDFIKANSLQMTLLDAYENPHMEGRGRGMFNYSVRIRRAGQPEAFTLFFSTGAGWVHKNGTRKRPTLDDVLGCLQFDARSIEDTACFEDWAKELGFDPDSRKAERLYSAVKTQAEELKAFLGERAYQELIEDLED